MLSRRERMRNIVTAALTGTRGLVMLNKVVTRILEFPHGRKSGRSWAESNSRPVGPFLRSLDPNLAREADEVAHELEQAANARLVGIPYDLGGGGCVPLLYFLVRCVRPETVLETGVAAGHSSAAILMALDRNDEGHLYSSDFPYFRLPGPEQYIGIVVAERLRSRWDLLIEGDRKNIPRILERVPRVDLVHYDSDKSMRGRRWFTDTVAPHLSASAVVLMDDIQDNGFFRKYVSGRERGDWEIFDWDGKYVGVVGLQEAGLRR